MALTAQLDGKALANYIIRWLRYWFERNERDTAVIGISGGKDSAVVAALCAKALGAQNVFGVMIPNGEQSDLLDAQQVVDELGIRATCVNIGRVYTDIIEATNLAPVLTQNRMHNGSELPYEAVSDAAKINIAPRLRMTVLYAIAQTLSQNGRHACVVGTGNLCEATVGYSTKWGDSACDVNPLRNLTVSEVIQVGDELGYFPNIVHKAPSDGLTGLTDEEKLGFSYADVEHYLNGEPLPLDIRAKIESKAKSAQHKLKPIPYPPRM